MHVHVPWQVTEGAKVEIDRANTQDFKDPLLGTSVPFSHANKPNKAKSPFDSTLPDVAEGTDRKRKWMALHDARNGLIRVMRYWAAGGIMRSASPVAPKHTCTCTHLQVQKDTRVVAWQGCFAAGRTCEVFRC